MLPVGMFKIFDGVDIQRFHFNPSANPDFEEFRNRVCKKLGIDCWASYDMLSLFYFDGEGDVSALVVGWHECTTCCGLA